jgi:putative selenate reductase
MTGLTPIPLGTLAARLFCELDTNGSIYDLPQRRFVLGDPARDVSLTIHGHRASTPFGPAAGPHTQLAQNIVLSWLVGARVIELKTVQAIDDLVIPRPCIDMATIGYNVEWSQELTLPQSLEEYVKAAMLIEVVKASGLLALAPGFGDTVFDMSVGYDLAGVKTDKVQAFIEGLKDATPIIDRLRRELPKPWADLDFQPRISDTLTLSTFHGCPPGEIEAIADHLLRANGLSVVVKLNPTLVGREAMRDLLNGRLGYTELKVPDEAFDKDASWDQAMGICGRLADTAETEGRGFGVKFSNTLIVENHRDFFPASERAMYTSGAPLHVLAVQLVRRFRREFGDRLPVSFSAGIDNRNFAEAVALGLAPVTACSDLLKPGGYARAQRYFQDLYKAMAAVGAADLDAYTLNAFGNGDAAKGDASAARLLNTETYADAVLDDPRYRRAATDTPPRRVGGSLALFDCLTCDKCVPVCPNDANFAFTVPTDAVETLVLARAGSGWTVAASAPQPLAKPHQIGNLADLCNECGNCDVFCPEDGGPYKVKPRFFLDEATWRRQAERDGLHLSGPVTLARIGGAKYRLEETEGTVRFAGPSFDVTFQAADPAGSLSGTVAGDTLDLTWWRILAALRAGALAKDRIGWLNAAA